MQNNAVRSGVTPEAVRSGVTPGAVRSGVIPPPKTTPLHAPEDRQHGALPDKLKEVCGYRKIV